MVSVDTTFLIFKLKNCKKISVMPEENPAPESLSLTPLSPQLGETKGGWLLWDGGFRGQTPSPILLVEWLEDASTLTVAPGSPPDLKGSSADPQLVPHLALSPS